MKKLICKVCETEFVPETSSHYITRDPGKYGLSILGGGTEEKLFDTFDCPQCGCQYVAQERKRDFREPTVEELEEEIRAEVKAESEEEQDGEDK